MARGILYNDCYNHNITKKELFEGIPYRNTSESKVKAIVNKKISEHMQMEPLVNAKRCKISPNLGANSFMPFTQKKLQKIIWKIV